MLEFIIGMDKIIYKWVIKKCAELGGLFMLGPAFGAFIYFMIAVWMYFKYQELIKGKREVRK